MVRLTASLPFNRTSMESKRAGGTGFGLGWVNPFNRTSMESKRDSFRSLKIVGFYLLIEPVWNRN